MARRLVEVDVDADHEVERVERLVEAGAVGGREHRVAGDGEERTDLAVARLLDLLGEAHHRQLAVDLGKSAHPARVPAEPDAPTLPRAGRAGSSGRGQREHRAARPVEVARQRVADVDEPRRERAELAQARADAAVDGGSLGGRELASGPPDRGRVDPAAGRDELRREVVCESLDVVDPREVRPGRAEVDEPLVEERVHEREQEQRVGAGPDRQVLVGLLRRLRAPRVDDHELAAARPQRLRGARAGRVR